MEIINLILGIILIILLIIFIILFIGIKISIKINKKGLQTAGFIKIIILEKIAIIKKEFPEKPFTEENTQQIKNISNNKSTEDSDKENFSEEEIIDKIKRKISPEESSEDEKSLTETIEKYKPLISDVKKTLPYFYNFLIDSFKSIEIKKFYFHLDFGYSDYCETAKIIGYYWSFAAFINSLISQVTLSACPEFNKPTLDFNSDIDIKIKALKIIPGLLKIVARIDFIKLLIKLKKLNDENE